MAGEEWLSCLEAFSVSTRFEFRMAMAAAQSLVDT